KMFANEKSLTRIVSSSSTLRGVHHTSGSASHTRNAVDAAVVRGSSAACVRPRTPPRWRSCRARRCRSGIVLLRSRGSERLRLGRLGSRAVGVLLGDVGLVVDALDVDGPDVVLRTGDQVV